jgi:hypothetical protein
MGAHQPIAGARRAPFDWLRSRDSKRQAYESTSLLSGFTVESNQDLQFHRRLPPAAVLQRIAEGRAGRLEGTP